MRNIVNSESGHGDKPSEGRFNAEARTGFDEVVVLDNGTEISVEAALGDLSRAADILFELGVEYEPFAGDLANVGRLLRQIAEGRTEARPSS